MEKTTRAPNIRRLPDNGFRSIPCPVTGTSACGVARRTTSRHRRSTTDRSDRQVAVCWRSLADAPAPFAPPCRLSLLASSRSSRRSSESLVALGKPESKWMTRQSSLPGSSRLEQRRSASCRCLRLSLGPWTKCATDPHCESARLSWFAPVLSAPADWRPERAAVPAPSDRRTHIRSARRDTTRS